jgi:ATP-dependent Clp protease ATP-binding subunit ClpB
MHADLLSAIYGARPLARVIQSEILNPLSRLLLQARVRDGETAHVTADVRRNRLVVIPNQYVQCANENKGAR